MTRYVVTASRPFRVCTAIRFRSRSSRLANPRQIQAMMQEGMDQRASRMPRGRVYDEAGRLIEHHEIGVFIQDLERDRLGRGGGWLGRGGGPPEPPAGGG